MLSPNVINAVKRLTSGYLFKSRHQTHSFFSFYLLRSQKLLSGEKRRFSERRRGQRTRPRTRPNSLSHCRSLARSLSSFTDGACRASTALLAGQGRSLSAAQWTVGARRWRWTNRDKMMSATFESRRCLAPRGPGQRVKSEGREGRRAGHDGLKRRHGCQTSDGTRRDKTQTHRGTKGSTADKGVKQTVQPSNAD